MHSAKSLTLLLMLIGTNWCAEAAERKPVPAEPALAAAEKLVKDVFGAEYAKTEPTDRRALAQKLFEQAQDTMDNIAARYVLFREAIKLAGKAGDFHLAFHAADVLAAEFAISSAKLKLPAAETAVSHVSADNAKELAALLLAITYDAVMSDDYESAARILKAADTAARKSKNLRLFSKVKALNEKLSQLRASYEEMRTSLIILISKPGDAEANLRVGRHYCFVNGDWYQGLPYLIKGSDLSLRELAQKDFNLPDSAFERLSVADGWYSLAARGVQDTTSTPRLSLVQGGCS